MKVKKVKAPSISSPASSGTPSGPSSPASWVGKSKSLLPKEDRSGGAKFSRKLGKIVPFTIFILNIKTKAIEYVSGNVKRNFGYSSKEILEMGNAFFGRVFDLNDVTISLLNKAKEKQSGDDDKDVQIIHLKHKAGHWLSCRRTAILMDRDDEGYPLRYLGVIEDISEETHTQQLQASITSSMSEGLILQDEQGHVTFSNPAAKVLFEVASNIELSEKLAALKWLDKSESPASSEIKVTGAAWGRLLARAFDLRVSQVDQVVGFEVDAETTRWIRVNIVLLPDQRKKQALITLTEITSEVNSYSDLQRIFNSSSDLIAIAHKDGTYRRASPSFKRILGYSPEQIEGSSFMEFVHPEDAKNAAQALDVLLMGVPIADFEIRYRASGGDYRRLSFNAELDRRTGLIYSTARDITDLRILEARNKQIIRIIHEAAIVSYTDERGRIIEVNDNFCKTSGYPRQELIGQDHGIVRSGKHSKEFIKNMWDTILDGRIWSGLLENKTRAGQFYFVRALISPLKDVDGTIEGYMSIRFDVTEEIATQRALEAEKAKAVHQSRLASVGEMAASVAHEISSPLTVLDGTLSVLLRNEVQSGPLFEKLQSMKKAVGRISKIVSTLKNHSRKNEVQEIKIERVEGMVAETLRLVEPHANKNGVAISSSIDVGLEVNCTALEIEQVLVNLVNNGIDAIEKLSEKWIKIIGFRDGPDVVIQVIDSGTGIAPEIEEKLFQPFFTTKPIGVGTGLGLAIVKGILDSHKATLIVNRRFKNTCFEIRFGAATQKEKAAA